MMQISVPLKLRPRGARKKSQSNPIKPATLDRPSVSHGYMKSFDGTQLFYSIEGQGKPLIFCYGVVCSSLHWTYQIEHFKNSYQTIWFDYRGHNNSEIPKNLQSLTIENIAQDMRVLLDELAIGEAVFLGHSMGVNIVLEFYRQYPKRVAGVVLANGTPKPPLETLFRHNGFQAIFKWVRKIHKKSPELIQLLWATQKNNPIIRTLVSLGGFNPHLTPSEDIQLYIQQATNTDLAIFLHLLESYESYDATSWLHSVQVPALILAGEHDKVIPIEQQQLMHQLIPDSRLEIIRHGSHCPQMDLPDLVNAKIEKFLGELNDLPQVAQTSQTMEIFNPPTETLSLPDSVAVG